MAGLASISIMRPVLAIVMSITIVIFGIIGFNFLGVREYPAVDPPVITVSTGYIGANADIIETQITEPLESSINGISGIKSLTSVSRDGSSRITVEFGLEIDMEAAANDVRDRVSRAVSSLPPDIDAPVVTKADANSFPIIFLNVTSQKRSLLELSAFAENFLKERFQTIPGVSEARVWGSKRYSMRLNMDPDKLAAYGLTPSDVLNAVNSENVELPSGLVEGLFTELTVRTQGRLNHPQEYNDLILKQDENSIVRFRDIGNATLAPENERTILKRDGVPMVMVVLNTQPGSNALEISEEFHRRMAIIQKDIPEDINATVSLDSSKYIIASINEVKQTIFIAFSLVVLIIFLFLRDWRTTLIPVLTIPISLIGAFFIMYIAGFSINVLTLLGIVLAIGLVVDDTIVVLENIYTKIEGGEEPKQAARKGSTEIYFAVIATTVALASVFLPVIFLQGLTGRLFREFGVVVAGAVIISSFVALSLTPMLSSKILKKRERHNFFYRWTEPFFDGMSNWYNKSLEAFMKFRWVAFLVVLGSAFGIYYGFSSIPTELAPKEDRNRFQIIATGPEGATFEYMDRYVDELNAMVLEEVPEADGIISVTSPGFGSGGVNSAFMFGILKDPDQREKTQSEIVSHITPMVAANTKARAFVTEPESIGSRGLSSFPVQYVVQAPAVNDLKEVLDIFFDKASQDPTFTFVNVDLKFNKPEITIEIDRERANTLGVSVRDVATNLQLALSGRRFGYFIMDGKQYQVIGQVDRGNRNDPHDLTSLYVRNTGNELIQLDNLVKFKEQSTPPQLYRYNRYAAATFSASLAPGKTMGDGIAAMDRIAGEVLGDKFSTSLSGSSQEFQESSNSLYFAFVFALILIYLVLAAQFESFKDPLIIMFTVPLAIAGALLTLNYFGQTLNIFSQIGIIMLIGLVTKNGILIVEFANQRKARGMNIMEAIVGAAEARFRPILMTSLSTILGILPIALALGAGAQSRTSMGIGVIGGLIFSTILTLYVIPAIYSYFTGKESRVARF
jgi:multidrug efflux pump